MAASLNLSDFAIPSKPSVSKLGVLTIHGYGVKVSMNSGHLEIEDGVGNERRKLRLPRIGHSLKRLVCISEDGFATFAALKWLSDVGVPFTMLNRDGKVLFVTSPSSPSDVRLRRAQATAHSTGAAFSISRELIDRKLAGQEQVARERLHAPDVATTIRRYRSDLAEVETLDGVRNAESQGAAAYWAGWRNIAVSFPRKDIGRLPIHWQQFGTRVSPLTGSPRVAVNPVNAMLNYLYSILETESTLAAISLGLDPGLGFLHLDTKARNSLACDLMEPIRPQVDAFLLDWIVDKPLNRGWFFERQDGNCRLDSKLAIQLSETGPHWGKAVAPTAEFISHALWTSSRKPVTSTSPPTRLTQNTRRKAKGAIPFLPNPFPPNTDNLCRGCGKSIARGNKNCLQCAPELATANLLEAARAGRVAAKSPEARAKRAQRQRQNALAQHAWNRSNHSECISEKKFSERIQPRLSELSASLIARTIHVSRWYAGRIREGYRPHERHWERLADLANRHTPQTIREDLSK